MIARRSFLTGLSSMLAAPAIVHAGNLMPVKSFKTINWYRNILIELGDIVFNNLDILYGIMKLNGYEFPQTMIEGTPNGLVNEMGRNGT